MNTYLQFLDPGQDISVAYLSTYSVPLVMLSVLMAVLASFVALHLTGRIQHAATSGGAAMWLTAGSLAMGGGVWAMHFIGMLAFNLPCGISYDPIMTLVSMVPGVLASAVALATISRPVLSLRDLGLGGTLMGGGIGTMHYSGMAAMHLDGVIYYSPVLFGVSLGFAIILAMISLYAKFVLQSRLQNRPQWGSSILGALIMGIAISGMHYIALEAAYFIPGGGEPTSGGKISPTILALGITMSVTMVMLMTFVISVRARLLETIKDLKAAVVIREHTEKELFDKVTELNFQKYALDEHAIVSITDVKGDITYVNSKFCDISGYSRDELLGHNHRILKSGGHAPQFYKALWKTIASGKPWHGEIKNHKKDGGFYWVKATIVPFLNGQGKPFQYVAIRTDITERKEAERDAEEARAEAEIANQAKTNFLANMSHELRTPLNAIMGFSEMIQLQAFGPIGSVKYIDYINDIHDSGSHLLSLVNDILHMSKIEAGSYHLSVEEIDAHALVCDCLTMVEGRAEDGGVSLVNDVAKDFPPLLADNRAIKQCMINLLSNAVKFTQASGSVTISTCLSERWYDLIITDTGVGVAKDDLPRLTHPFSKIERTQEAHVHAGTGIGLSITQGLIKMHGGALEIDSELGVGTTVTIHLPRDQTGDLGEGDESQP